MKWLFPFGPILIKFYQVVLPEKFQTEKALMILAVFNIVFTLALYVLLGLAVWRFLAG